MDRKTCVELWSFVLVALLVCIPSAMAEDAGTEPPHLDWDQPVWCVKLGDKTLRVQCDQATRRCLVAPDTQAGGQPLRRLQECTWGRQADFDQARDLGWTMVDAVAEAPPGWYRDEKGRVFQVTFDLLKRFYLGAGWQPGFALAHEEADLARVRFDLGFEASWLSAGDRDRHAIRGLEGFVVIDDLEAQALLFAYDLSHASARPVLRLTTFFGQPRRHDLFMDIGWGMRLLDLHVHPHRAEGIIGLEFGELHAAWDIWQSADLYDHLRLEAGLAAEGMWDVDSDEARYFLTPQSRLEARFCLDRKGFHHLRGDIRWAMPIRLDRAFGQTRSRAGFRAGYELIFAAVNDQPLTFVVEAGLDYRDDLARIEADPWEVQIITGLRLSFWAPARLDEDLPALAGR
ncbi:MAG: hypothetical protein JXR96_11535 [Deltaproteobacteria bacterium]|nr:hypothetical protein [Deltaproteobacteria bacterium]